MKGSELIPKGSDFCYLIGGDHADDFWDTIEDFVKDEDFVEGHDFEVELFESTKREVCMDSGYELPEQQKSCGCEKCDCVGVLLEETGKAKIKVVDKNHSLEIIGFEPK